MAKVGIENTIGILKLVKIIGVAVGHEVAAHGVNPRALTAVVEAPGFQEQLKQAMQEVKLVSAEMADLDLIESFELAREALGIVKEVVAAFALKAVA